MRRDVKRRWRQGVQLRRICPCVSTMRRFVEGDRRSACVADHQELTGAQSAKSAARGEPAIGRQPLKCLPVCVGFVVSMRRQDSPVPSFLRRSL
ncbi:hypothetical protein LN474_09815 [Xanthomonas codiaei]|uniref:hypothetical protein n=1 Tax=Xanthomonas codiaei TaxID=56463 RepID=UPI001E39C873|nr:hypothetical protein [Xanthomonas codiaei]MCC8537270.1 hypothetical protein [Xanthomonas codiaei]